MHIGDPQVGPSEEHFRSEKMLIARIRTSTHYSVICYCEIDHHWTADQFDCKHDHIFSILSHWEVNHIMIMSAFCHDKWSHDKWHRYYTPHCVTGHVTDIAVLQIWFATNWYGSLDVEMIMVIWARLFAIYWFRVSESMIT